MVVTPSPVELGLIIMIFVLLFGPKKVPELARSIGESIGEFKKGRQNVQENIDSEMVDVNE